MKKLSKYKKFIIVYLGVLILLMIASLAYVLKSLSTFEKNQPEKFVLNLANKIKENPSKYVNINKEYVDGYKNILKSEKVTAKETEDGYQIIAGSSPLFNLKLEKGKEVTKLGILKFNILSLKEINPTSENGAYYYKVKIPSSFTLKVNGKTLDNPVEKLVNEDFEEIGSKMPMDYIYELKGLKEKPNIEILNNKGEVVKYETEDNTIYSYEFYKTNDYKKEVKNPIDILEFAKKWSLFYTKDLAGGNAGFDVLKPYLLEGNKMYEAAKAWPKSVDWGFVSRHILKNPIFTNESVKDCYIYNDDAFSCIVKLEKNMIVKGEDKVETLNDRMFFVNDNGWKFVNMMFISE